MELKFLAKKQALWSFSRSTINKGNAMDQDKQAQEQYDNLSDEVTDFILKKMEEVQTSKRFKNIDETDFMHSLISTIGMTLSYHMEEEEIADFVSSVAIEGAREQKSFDSEGSEES